MIRHLFRLVWNRKRANGLLTVEIAVSFLVLFVVVLVATYYARNYLLPIGFDIQDVWTVSVDVKQQSDDYWNDETVAKLREVQNAIRDMPEVESSAAALNVPFSNGYSISGVTVAGREIDYQQCEVTDPYAEVMRLDITRGRWFSPDDDAMTVTPVVINEGFARVLFGDDDPIGKSLTDDDERHSRIIGVVSEYRRDGEFSGGTNALFNRANLDDGKLRPPRNFVIRVNSGTTADFEEKLARSLQPIARDWSFEVKSLTELHDLWIHFTILPLLIVGLIAGFLLIMVGLGLTGVLWQTISYRTREVGLRRVQGATAVDICLQFLGELLMVATFGLVIGVLLVLQAPLLGLTGPIGSGVFMSSVAISVGLIYLLTIACGLYPSWLATRIEPVEALRYE